MGRRIREDFDGVVQAYEFGKDGKRIGGVYTLAAGAHVPDEVQVPAHLLEPEDGLVVDGERPGVFDPSSANVHEVNAYLDGVSDTERQRILVLEASGHDRKGILDGPYSQFAPARASQQDPSGPTPDDPAPAGRRTTKKDGE